MFDDLTGNLADAGFLVYRFDFSGRGESQGDYSETSLSKQRSDLLNVLHFIQSQEKVDKARIGILAQSFGTAVTVALIPAVKTIILMGSIAHPQSVMGLPSKWVVLDKNGLSKRLKTSGEIILIKPQFWKDMENYNLLESISHIHCPILFIHGSLDDKVPLSEMEAYFEKANKPKERITIDGADHGLRPHRDQMYQIVADWFKKYLI